MLCAGHEDDYVIELANVVRKELGKMGDVKPKDQKAIGAAKIAHPTIVPIPNLQLHPLPQPIS